jgi:hypothetical protein
MKTVRTSETLVYFETTGRYIPEGFHRHTRCDFRFSRRRVWRRLFWDVAPYSPVEVDRRFGGVYCFHNWSRHDDGVSSSETSVSLPLYTPQYPTRLVFLMNVLVQWKSVLRRLSVLIHGDTMDRQNYPPCGDRGMIIVPA